MRHSFASLALLALATLGGCDTSKIPDVVNKQAQQINQQVQQTVESAKNQVLPPGIELTTTPVIKASTCYGKWVAPYATRPGVITLSSYREGGAETYPSVFATINAPMETLDKCKGRTVEAKLYVRRAADQPVLRSPAKEPVQLKIESVQGKTIVCQVVKGSLVDVETGDAYPFLGKLTAEVE